MASRAKACHEGGLLSLVVNLPARFAEAMHMPRFQTILPNLFLWTSTCNTYVLKSGSKAILIDLGDGSVLDHLTEIGVQQVEWVLFTHHHREQCQGAERLQQLGAKVACGVNEKAFFEQPLNFRRFRPKLGDPFTVHGTSYVRPPVQPVKIDHAFQKMDTFTWEGHEFWCVETPGNSPGHMSYCWKPQERWLVFSGDLMLAGSKLHTWFDTEWDYGFAAGIYAQANSAGQIAGYNAAWLLPSHGAPIPEANDQLLPFIAKLKELAQYYVRGYDINRFAGCDQDNVSRPSKVPHLWQLSKHLFKFRGPNYWVNFGMVLSDSGHALLVDCGLFDRDFLDRTIEQMQLRLGLKKIDAVFVTHMHGDHALEAEHLRNKYGTEVWGMAGVVEKFEHPYDYDLSALLPMYGKDAAPLKFDRVLRDGETVQWEGFSFTCDWMPGQTKYHSCFHGEIDGQIVAFTGDNLFANPTDPSQGGNECVLARNGGVLEEGYLYAAHYLHNLGPDLLIGGHCWAMAEPRMLIERLRERMLKLRACFAELCPAEDYRLTFDPYQVEAFPYRTQLAPGETRTVAIRVHNWLQRPMAHRLALHLPPGLQAEPRELTGTTERGGSTVYRVKITAQRDAALGLQLVAIDTTFGTGRMVRLLGASGRCRNSSH
jgi:glyoxylase-like metal-dependent hydrolase (beta-lactamase superfamily II)